MEYGRFVSFTPTALSALRPHCTLGRSFGLLDDFKYEQTDPDRFYGHLAEDTVALLEGIAAVRRSRRDPAIRRLAGTRGRRQAERGAAKRGPPR